MDTDREVMLRTAWRENVEELRETYRLALEACRAEKERAEANARAESHARQAMLRFLREQKLEGVYSIWSNDQALAATPTSPAPKETP